MRTLYVNPLEYGQNIGIDAIGHGLQHELAQAGIDLRIVYADFREADCDQQTSAAVRAGIEAGVDAIAIYALTPALASAAMAEARAAGIPVFAFVRPHYPVNGSVMYPNFNHGILMTEYLAKLLPPGADIAVIGGPDVVDDRELALGLERGAKVVGLNLVNDPYDPRYDNISDISEMGRDVTLNVLDDFPQIVGLIPYNDETMHGSVEALRERGRLGEITMVSRNGTPKAVEAIRNGWHHGTLDIDCPGIGTALGGLVVRQLRGEQLTDEIALSPVGRVIGADNLAAWVPLNERIPFEPFHVGLD